MVKRVYDFVLDCSITMAWCFEDEGNHYTDSILENFRQFTAIVPTLWSLEVANVLLIAKKNKRITEIQAVSFIDILAAMPIVTDSSRTTRSMHTIFALAEQAEITIYDAAYLEIALREQIPLLTLDKALIKAAKKLDISLEIPKK